MQKTNKVHNLLSYRICTSVSALLVSKLIELCLIKFLVASVNKYYTNWIFICVGSTLVCLYMGLNVGVNKCLHKSLDVFKSSLQVIAAAFMSLLPHSFVMNI